MDASVRDKDPKWQISRRAFVELLGQCGLSVFQTDKDELSEDIC